MIDSLITKPASKKEVIAASADAVRERIQDGEFTLKDYALLKRAEAAIETMISVSKQEAVRLYEQYSSKELVQVDGVTFTSYITKPSLNYGSDYEYQVIKAELEEAESKLQPIRDRLAARKELLDNAWQQAEKGLKVLDENGEVVPVPKIAKKGIEVLKTIY